MLPFYIQEDDPPGTLSAAATMVAGGRDVHQGVLRRRAIAFSTWYAATANGRGRTFAAAPRAELVAVQRSTGIPNVVVGIPLSCAASAVMRVGSRWVWRLLAWQAARVSARVEPDQSSADIAALRSRAWAEAGDAVGRRVAAMLETGEGYRAAAAAAVRGVELQLHEPRMGAVTPVQAFGAGFAELVPGTQIQGL